MRIPSHLRTPVIHGAALSIALLLPACENHAQDAAPPAVESAQDAAAVDATDAQASHPTDEATAQEAPPLDPGTAPPEAPPDPTGTTDAPPVAGGNGPVSNEGGQAQGASENEATMFPAEAAGDTQPAAAAARRAAEVAAPVHSPAERAAEQPVRHVDPARVETVPVAPAARATALRQERFRIISQHVRPPVALLVTEVPERPQVLMQLKGGNVGIGNLDPSLAVNFAMKSPMSEWRNERLGPSDTEEFTCGGALECLFWMRTGQQPAVFYKLRWPGRYAIVWDTAQTRWDLRKDTRTDGE